MRCSLFDRSMGLRCTGDTSHLQFGPYRNVNSEKIVGFWASASTHSGSWLDPVRSPYLVAMVLSVAIVAGRFSDHRLGDRHLSDQALLVATLAFRHDRWPSSCDDGEMGLSEPKVSCGLGTVPHSDPRRAKSSRWPNSLITGGANESQLSIICSPPGRLTVDWLAASTGTTSCLGPGTWQKHPRREAHFYS